MMDIKYITKTDIDTMWTADITINGVRVGWLSAWRGKPANTLEIRDHCGHLVHDAPVDGEITHDSITAIISTLDLQRRYELGKQRDRLNADAAYFIDRYTIALTELRIVERRLNPMLDDADQTQVARKVTELGRIAKALRAHAEELWSEANSIDARLNPLQF